MRLGIDGTPLLGPRSGIGRYTAELLGALTVRPGADVVVTAFTGRGGADLPAAVPPGTPTRSRAVPARLLQEMWMRAPLPPVEWLTGEVDVFHGTNFVLPPLRRAGGVVTVHDLTYLRHPRLVAPATRRLVDLVPRSLRRAAAVCVPSAAVAADVAEAYPWVSDRIVVTHLGVSPEWSAAPRPTPGRLRALGVPESYVLFTGTLEPRKDLDTVVRAYRLLLARHAAPPPLVLVGASGWGRALDLTGEMGNSTVSLGRVDDGDLRSLLAGAQALVYPSLYEGFGLPLLEAFACGTPVVASAIPTTVEVLGQAGHLARLFPPGDVEHLAGLLGELPEVDDAARAARRAHAARFTWSATAEATTAAYRSALG